MRSRASKRSSVCSRSPRTPSESRCRRRHRACRGSVAPDGDVRAAIEELTRSVAAFRAGGHRWGEALSLVALGRVSLAMGQLEQAVSLFDQSLAAATAGGDGFTESIAMHHIGRMQLFAGQTDAAAATFRDSLRLSIGLDHDEGVAYAIEGLSAIAALGGDLDRAGVLAGAARDDPPAGDDVRLPGVRLPLGVPRAGGSGRGVAEHARESHRARPRLLGAPRSPTTRSARRRTRARLPRRLRRRGGAREDPSGHDVFMTGGEDPVIRTPDQRIRVFVSSTLRELAAERRAVRAAIEAMHLAPVMFELGARPHPPRDLYRSYLAAERRVRRHLLATATAGSRPARRSPASRTSTTSPRMTCRSSSTEGHRRPRAEARRR